MKKKFLLCTLMVVGIALIMTSMTRINPNNPPLGNTGAPGETTCQKSGCHSGGSYSGIPTLSGLPDSVEAGVVYNLTITLNSDCKKAGFEMTCLDASDNKCGTLVTGTGTSVAMFAGNQYIRQNAPHTLTGGSTSWNFTWTCPETADGNIITFYFAMLNADGNGHDSNDNVCKGDTSVVLKEQVVPTDIAQSQKPTVSLSPNPVDNLLTVSLPGTENGTLILFNINGDIVLHRYVSSGNSIIDLTEIPSGMYTADIKTPTTNYYKKIIVH